MVGRTASDSGGGGEAGPAFSSLAQTGIGGGLTVWPL
jgi:hypothetical protein